MLIQINTNIAATAQDSIRIQHFHNLTAAWEKNVIIFGADMNSSVHIDNKGKYNLILGERATQGSHDTTFTAY